MPLTHWNPGFKSLSEHCSLFSILPCAYEFIHLFHTCLSRKPRVRLVWSRRKGWEEEEDGVGESEREEGQKWGEAVVWVEWRSELRWTRRRRWMRRKRGKGRNSLLPSDICFSEWLISYWIEPTIFRSLVTCDYMFSYVVILSWFVYVFLSVAVLI